MNCASSQNQNATILMVLTHGSSAAERLTMVMATVCRSSGIRPVRVGTLLAAGVSLIVGVARLHRHLAEAPGQLAQDAIEGGVAPDVGGHPQRVRVCTEHRRLRQHVVPSHKRLVLPAERQHHSSAWGLVCNACCMGKRDETGKTQMGVALA